MGVSRRDFLIGGLSSACGCAIGAAGWQLYRPFPPFTSLDGEQSGIPEALAPESPSAQKSLELLMAGNTRFASGTAQHPHVSREWREGIVAGQHPYAAILGCSDSRVSPEVIFDEGLGELFIVRQAGHVADEDTLGSIEYAVGHLHIPLVVVLGHQNCGAVEAAVGSIIREEPTEGHIVRLVDDITPAVLECQGQKTSQQADFIDSVVRANIRQTVNRLRTSGPVLRPMERRGEVRMVGAYYPLRTGIVEWLRI